MTVFEIDAATVARDARVPHACLTAMLAGGHDIHFATADRLFDAVNADFELLDDCNRGRLVPIPIRYWEW